MHRHSSGASRQQPASRAVSTSAAFQNALPKSAVPSRLNNVRSASDSIANPRLGRNGNPAEAQPVATFLGIEQSMTASPGKLDTSEYESDAADDINDRPTKRARRDTAQNWSNSSTTPSAGGLQDEEAKAVPGTPLPLPKELGPIRTAPAPDRAARRAHGLTPPSIATRLPAPRKAADFFPWSGSHPEDIMSEAVIKSGYSDRSGLPVTAEGISAKATIWPNLSQKNNVGLSTLSHLFTTVMEKRQMNGRCTSATTFKPPPRVTVTDTKREAWLRDLANPLTPLRKQSRTIPHGIRGKLLMEQCLAKSIPVNRAVWLAKCVGANELRAFRRKGVAGAAAASGESKWVREWTINVEQFLESVVAACGQAEWRTKMDYAARLATNFYTERLLEREHYLDWMAHAFAHADINRLPIWMILTQLYWKDIFRYGRRGRRLAEAILAQLDTIDRNKNPAFDQLRTRLQKLIVAIALSSRSCLISPNIWQKYSHLLANGSAKSLPSGTLADSIARRNMRLVQPLTKLVASTRCALLKLYTELDELGTSFDAGTLAQKHMQLLSDHQKVVHAYLNWAASVYRAGQTRIYIAAALIQKLQSSGHNTDQAIVEYLQIAETDVIHKDHIIQLICELVRISAFSVGRLFQWIMTSGILTSSKPTDLLLQVLQALPKYALSTHLYNTRQMLLSRAGLETSSSLDAAGFDLVIDELVQGGIPDLSAIRQRLDVISPGERYEFCHRLKHATMASTKLELPSLQTVCNIRGIFERCNDYAAMADLLDVLLSSSDTTILATACDTLNMNAGIFAAMGRQPSMTNHLLEHYRKIRSEVALDRDFLLAVKALEQYYPTGSTDTITMLDNDLLLCDQHNAMMVCSPASDNLVSMQSSSLDSDHDIDAVFASGNTMDEALMQRVFERIIQRAAKPGAESVYAPSKVCSWFNQLRSVDVVGFDQLVKQILAGCLQALDETEAALNVISTLVASGCVAFEAVLDVLKPSVDRTDDNTRMMELASLYPAVVTTDHASQGLHVVEKYRYKLRRQQCLASSAGKVVSLLGTALRNMSAPMSSSSDLHQALLQLAVKQPETLRATLNAVSHSPEVSSNYHNMLSMCLAPQNTRSSDADKLDAENITLHASPLSIFWASRNLEYLSAGSSDKNVISSVQDAVVKAIKAGSDVWPQLLEASGANTIRSVYGWVKTRAFDLTVANDNEDQKTPSNTDVQKIFDIMDVAHHSSADEEHGPDSDTLAERIAAIESTFSSVCPSLSDVHRQRVMCSLYVLLHLSTLHCATSVASGDGTVQSRCHLLTALCTLLVAPGLQHCQSQLEYIADVAAALSDSLPEAVLAQLPRSLINLAIRDQRIASIIGCPPTNETTLALVSQSTQSQPQTQQQQQQQRTTPKGPQFQPSIASLPPRPPAPQRTLSTLSNPGSTSSPAQSTHSNSAAALAMIRQAAAAASSSGAGSNPGNAGAATGNASGSDASVAANGGKSVPFVIRRWEVIPDAAPNLAENDASLSLTLFAARRV